MALQEIEDEVQACKNEMVELLATIAEQQATIDVRDSRVRDLTVECVALEGGKVELIVIVDELRASRDAFKKQRDRERVTVQELRAECERLRRKRNFADNMMYLMKHAAEDEARGETKQ